MKERNILQILKNSEYTVVLLGVEMILENGYPALRDGFASYDLEQKYGYCPEEIISSAFYETRKDFFFRFYKEEILKIAEELPGKGYQSLKKLQDYGLIQTIITKRIFGLADRAGCIDVINLHGTVYENICPKCGKSYSVEYIKNAKGVPLCENCLVSIRPKIILYGEMVDNEVMTKAAFKMEKADVALVLGAPIHASMCQQLLQYYKGKKIILVKAKEHFSDTQADICIHSRCDTFLTGLVRKYEQG
ncbi:MULTISPECIES: SIR2 family NAD-dependent protein deacylase [Mediterraneibacter]|uniref:SIR2 family NAD-dependent protein deacylase n=1 Tax=Mediterraneibacter TaxID=2316020 RepID=UPI0022E62F1C|nr:Sir2 family NAD-dependent protein deacetylase [Mediterraneibacter massiliensis]